MSMRLALGAPPARPELDAAVARARRSRTRRGRARSARVARVVRAAPRAHLRRGPGARRRSRPARATRRAVLQRASLPDRAGARSAAGHRRSRRARLISTRTTWCSPPSTRRRARNGMRCTCSTSPTATSRPSSRPGGAELDRGGAAPALRRDDAREDRSPPHRAAQVLRDAAVAHAATGMSTARRAAFSPAR